MLNTAPAKLPVFSAAFASDNCAGMCPEASASFSEANCGYAPAYGDDAWTARTCTLLRDLFETDCELFFCFNGTAANSMAIGHLCNSYHSVICHECAHVETDECGGPEFFTNGTKLLLACGDEGKVSPDAVEAIVQKRTDIHYPKPRVLSVTQATELGTVYSIAELSALGEVARRHGLRIHMDGARFANALATLGAAAKDMTWKIGVDVLCFGGTKLGMPVGDAVVFFNRELAQEFDYRCKQAGQLASKMRFLTAPWLGMLSGGAWLKHAKHANACAQQLAGELRQIPGVHIMFATQANSVFLEMPVSWASALRTRGWRFYTFIGGGARFMCSWQTTGEEISALVAHVREIAEQSPSSG